MDKRDLKFLQTCLDETRTIEKAIIEIIDVEQYPDPICLRMITGHANRIAQKIALIQNPNFKDTNAQYDVDPIGIDFNEISRAMYFTKDVFESAVILLAHIDYIGEVKEDGEINKRYKFSIGTITDAEPYYFYFNNEIDAFIARYKLIINLELFYQKKQAQISDLINAVKTEYGLIGTETRGAY